MFLGSGTLISLSWIMWLAGILLLIAQRYRRPPDPQVLAAAAAAGDARAVRGLRTLALDARSQGRPEAAERMLRQAAKAGDVESMWELGRLLQEREGLATAEPWLITDGRRARSHRRRRLFRAGGELNRDGSSPL
ncbi:Sel1 repeat family protein OS=Streptomyces microflavus OX=1919 GN=Smic_32470 PE=4 SV=1 [Streptomyces microflavus]